MLAKTGGNMHEVYREFWRIQEIAERVEPEMNRAVARAPKMEAEITEGATADWYLVHTLPGDDIRAMRWLARRRFGVFRPMQQRNHESSEGQPIGGMEPVFPCHLFVFVWDIEKMRGRLVSCPGVRGILCTAEGRPIGVNLPDRHGKPFIDTLRELSWVYEERLGHVAQEAERRLRPAKLGRKERKTIKALKRTLKSLGKFEPSTWAKAAELAPVKRIALLMQVLQGPVVEGGASLEGA